MSVDKFYVNTDTGEVVNALPSVDCVDDVEIKSYNRLDYHRAAKRDLRAKCLLEKRYNNKNGYFVTLTYDDRCLPDDDPQILKKHVQDFIKRLRVFQERKLHIRKKIKYIAVVEHGEEKGRLHHHLLIWNLSPYSVAYMCRSNSFMANIWSHGFVHCKHINNDKIRYCLKYVFKQQNGNVYKCLRSKDIGKYVKNIRALVIKSCPDGRFRSGLFFYRIPLSILRRCFNPKGGFYKRILVRYHLFVPDNFTWDDLKLNTIAINGNEFRFIPRGLYKLKKHQLECNNYDIRTC